MKLYTKINFWDFTDETTWSSARSQNKMFSVLILRIHTLELTAKLLEASRRIDKVVPSTQSF